MYLQKKFAIKIIVCTGILVLPFACIKAPVDLRDNQPANDPDITYIDTNTVNLATYMLDSFVTSNDSSFAIGYVHDSVFGTLTASTYFQVNLPFTNDVKDESVSFDSIVVMLKPNHNYYGDTLLPVTYHVYKLLDKIEDDDASNT